MEFRKTSLLGTLLVAGCVCLVIVLVEHTEPMIGAITGIAAIALSVAAIIHGLRSADRSDELNRETAEFLHEIKEKVHQLEEFHKKLIDDFRAEQKEQSQWMRQQIPSRGTNSDLQGGGVESTDAGEISEIMRTVTEDSKPKNEEALRGIARKAYWRGSLGVLGIDYRDALVRLLREGGRAANSEWADTPEQVKVLSGKGFIISDGAMSDDISRIKDAELSDVLHDSYLPTELKDDPQGELPLE